MTAKRYTKQIDRVADTIINIQKDGKDFAWFLLDDYTNDEVDKVIEELNHLHEENEFLKIKNEKTQESLRQKDKRINYLLTKEEDAEYELLHLKEMYEELLMEKQEWKTK